MIGHLRRGITAKKLRLIISTLRMHTLSSADQQKKRPAIDHALQVFNEVSDHSVVSVQHVKVLCARLRADRGP